MVCFCRFSSSAAALDLLRIEFSLILFLSDLLISILSSFIFYLLYVFSIFAFLDCRLFKLSISPICCLSFWACPYITGLLLSRVFLIIFILFLPMVEVAAASSTSSFLMKLLLIGKFESKVCLF